MVCPLLSAFLILLGRNWIRWVVFQQLIEEVIRSHLAVVLLCAVKSEFCTVHFFLGLGLSPLYTWKLALRALFCFLYVSVQSQMFVRYIYPNSPSKQTFEQAHLEPNTVESQILTLFGLGRVTVIRLLGVWIERWFMMRAGHRVCVPSGRGLSSVCPGLILRRRRLSLT